MLASSSSNSSFLAIENFKVSCCWFVALNERALLQYAEATPSSLGCILWCPGCHASNFSLLLCSVNLGRQGAVEKLLA